MIKLSNLADYGVMLMGVIAKDKTRLFNAQSLAEETGLQPPTISKVLGMLTRAGILTSKRGAYGGFQFPEDKEDITISEIVEAIDGPIALTHCVIHTDENVCEFSDTCVTKPHWPAINNAVKGALMNVTINQIIDGSPKPNAE